MSRLHRFSALVLLATAFAAPAAAATGKPASLDASDYYQAKGDPMLDNAWFSKLMFDQLEWQGRDGSGQFSWDAQGWLGGDFHKLWVKTEGVRAEGRTDDAEFQVLYDHPISAYFDLQTGLRHDWGTARPDRDWLAFGVQGLAPYYFELEATAFLGRNGRSAARFKASYDVLFTQRLILSPELEFNLQGKRDRELGIGTGLSDASLGLRLRYEIRRELAPYVGIEVTRKFGATADYARADGEAAQQTVWVAGLRAWF